MIGKIVRCAAWAACSLAALGIAGCGASPNAPSGNGSANGKNKPAEPAEILPELTGDVKLEVASWDEVQSRIAAHKGKIVVLDVWSNWCEPCTKEFPNLVKLQRRHLDDVVCMSLNTNFDGLESKEPTEKQKTEALEFLTKNGAKFKNFLSTVQDEELYQKLDIASIPCVLVYGRDGKLAKSFNNDDKKQFNGEFTYAKHIEPFVKQLVDEKKAAPAAGR